MEKKYIEKEVIRILRDIDSSSSTRRISENDIIGEILGNVPENRDEFIMMLKIMELIVAAEYKFGIKIKKDPRNFVSMKLRDFVDYIYYMT